MVDIVDISLAYEQIKTDITNCVFYYDSFSAFSKDYELLAVQIIHLGLLKWIICTEAFTHLILFQWLISAGFSKWKSLPGTGTPKGTPSETQHLL